MADQRLPRKDLAEIPPLSPAAGQLPSSSRPTIRPEHLYKTVALFFLLLIVFNRFTSISRVLLLGYAAVILAIALNEVVRLLPAHRRGVSVVLGLLIFAALGAAAWLGVPALAGQLRGLLTEIPRLQQQLEAWGAWLTARTGLNVAIFGGESQQFAGRILQGAFGTARGLVEGLLLPIVIVVGALYAVAKPNERLLTPLLKVIPRERRESFRRLFELLAERLRAWVKGTLLAMTAVGILTALALSLIGVRYALLLGFISGLLEVIPLLGPWVAGGIAVAVAFLDDPAKAVWVVLLMVAIQQVEANLITPLVMSSAVRVHPFFTLFALFFFGSIFGFFGVLLAMPLVLLVWTTVEVLWVEHTIQTERDYIEPLVKE